MASYGDDWERFSSRHLGHWHARSLAISVADGSVISSASFRLSSHAPVQSQTNPSSLLLPWSVLHDTSNSHSPDSETAELHLRYNLDKLHVFADGTYSADHSLLELCSILPSTHSCVPYAIEFALPASATERVRAFLLYDDNRTLTALLLLEEARSGLFDTRAPLAISSLVGHWAGISETFRHDAASPGGGGFARKTPSPSKRARRVYDENDLPEQLKNASGGGDGLMKTKSAVQFGWDPIKGTVRRATVLSDMQNYPLGRSVIYGALDSNDGGLFDFIRFESRGASESLLAALNNGCFIMAPVKRVRGVPASGELACHITPGFRRRVLRIYGKTTVASETLASESLTW